MKFRDGEIAMQTTTKPTNTTTTTQKLLTTVVVLQVLTLLGLWTSQPGSNPAQAAIPDPGAQREAMVEQQKATNEKLDRLLTMLGNGSVKVKVETDEKKK